MTVVYRCLLNFYPRLHRREFADEMLEVLVAAEAEARGQGIGELTTFYVREVTGLIRGALREQLCVDLSKPDVKMGGIMIRPTRCRFPRSAIFMMGCVFVVVVGMIVKIQGVSHAYGRIITGELPHQPFQWPSYYGLLSGIAVIFLLAWAVGGAVWAIAYAMSRTAAQHLGDFEAWPQARQ